MKKQEFILPEKAIYLCGHSLGPSSKMSVKKVKETLKDWNKNAVVAWNTKQWIDLPYQISTMIAPLIGAHPHEVMIGDSTSVNLYKVLKSAFALNKGRKILLMDNDDFPSNLYIAQGVEHYKNDMFFQSVNGKDLLQLMNKNVAVLLLSHANYRSGLLYDMKAVTKKAQQLGIIVIWDISHSVGAMPIYLHENGVDFAVGCTYKYLNGGPGAPSFIFVHEKHHTQIRSPITGWMSHIAPFEFKNTFHPIKSAAKFLVGTPSILSLKALEGALHVFRNIDMTYVRKKSLLHSSYLMNSLIGELMCLSPVEESLRGGHVAFMHEMGFAISQALIAKGVICDYRAPHLIRFCVNPFYVSLADLKVSVTHIKEIVRQKHYLNSECKPQLKVT